MSTTICMAVYSTEENRRAEYTEFISRLMNTKIKLICTDNPGLNELTIHIIASVAQDEAKRISERTISALAVKKKRGEPLGCRAHKTPGSKLTEEIRLSGLAKIKQKSSSNPNNKRAIGYVRSLHENGLQVEQIVNKLNSEGFNSPKGKKIYKSTIYRWLRKTA